MKMKYPLIPLLSVKSDLFATTLLPLLKRLKGSGQNP